MKKRTPVSKIMATDIVTINHTTSLQEVAQLVKTKHIHHFPVVSGKKLIGIISKSDLERVSFITDYKDEKVSAQIYNSLTIEQVMTKNIQSVQKNDTILDVATILSKHEFHCLPVLDGENIVGIVTTTDLVKYLISLFEGN